MIHIDKELEENFQKVLDIFTYKNKFGHDINYFDFSPRKSTIFYINASEIQIDGEKNIYSVHETNLFPYFQELNKVRSEMDESIFKIIDDFFIAEETPAWELYHLSNNPDSWKMREHARLTDSGERVIRRSIYLSSLDDYIDYGEEIIEEREPFTVEEILEGWVLNGGYIAYRDIQEKDKDALMKAFKMQFHSLYRTDLTMKEKFPFLTDEEADEITQAQENLLIEKVKKDIRNKEEDFGRFVARTIRSDIPEYFHLGMFKEIENSLTNYELSEICKNGDPRADEEVRKRCFELIPESYRKYKNLH